MSNILVIGDYKTVGNDCVDYLRALKTTSHNIAARTFLKGGIINDFNRDIVKLEDNVFDEHPEVVFQMVPPEYMTPQAGALNVAFVKAYHAMSMIQIAKLQLMDKIVVQTDREKKLLEQVLDVPVFDLKGLPLKQDIKVEEVVPFEDIDGFYPSDFIFYFIGQYIERKNVRVLIEAFHREFLPSESVQLVIKTSLHNTLPHELFTSTKQGITEFKNTLKRFSDSSRYRTEYIVTEHLSVEELYQMHAMCDCFVMPSYQESINKPALEAMQFGNQVISSTGLIGSYTDVAPDGTDIKFLKALGANTEVPNVSVKNVMEAMRLAYVKRDIKQQQQVFPEYSYEVIGTKLARILEWT